MIFIVTLLPFISAVKLWDPAPENYEDGAIQQIHVIYRHGHREPKSSYPNNPHIHTDIWKNGPGQLTILGRQQGFSLGQNIRSRYATLFPEERAWKSIRAFSSDVPRTLMTSGVVLAGMIPPSAEDRWSDLNWQPGVTHTSPMKTDNLLAHPFCPRFNNLLQSVPFDMEDNFFDYVRKHSGKKMQHPHSFLNLVTCLEIERQAGLNLPNWTEGIYDEMKYRSAMVLLRNSWTKDLIRLRSGPLLNTITNFKANDVPIYLYSTHDTVIAGLLGALQINITEPPSFTSTIVVEHRTVNRKIHSQLWYRKGPNNELVRQEWPACGIRCPLNILKVILRPYIPEAWFLECNLKENSKPNKDMPESMRLVGEDRVAQEFKIVSYYVVIFSVTAFLIILLLCLHSFRSQVTYELL